MPLPGFAWSSVSRKLRRWSGEPALLLQIVDPHNDRVTRLRYAEWFFESPQGKVDPGISLKLRLTRRSCLGFWQQRFPVRWAWGHRLITIQTEFVHNRNLKQAHPDKLWASFAALYLLMESLYFHKIFRETIAPDAAAPLVLCDKPKRVRRKTAFEIFASDYGHTQKRKFNSLRNMIEVQAACELVAVEEVDRCEE